MGIWAFLIHTSLLEGEKRERSLILSEHRGSAETPPTCMCSCMYRLVIPTDLPPRVSISAGGSGVWPQDPSGSRVERLEAHPSSRNLCILPETNELIRGN